MSKTTRGKGKKVGRARLEIEVGQNKPPTITDVERAIKKALATQPTDLFRSRKTVTIVVEDEGGYRVPKHK